MVQLPRQEYYKRRSVGVRTRNIYLFETMRPLVRDLYKRFILAGRVYPQGLAAIRARIKKGFMENAKLYDDVSIARAVGRGRYWVRELVAVSKLHKYRAMRQRYSQEEYEDPKS